MIRSFGNEGARAAWECRFVEGWPQNVLRIGNRKLTQLHNARSLDDLRAPPGNRLEALSGNHAGQHSVRINDQWRVCFVWRDGDTFDVEIVDYH
jgi:proteic killer suppression protein